MNELIDVVKDHVADGLESAAGRKTVVLVGESHTSQAGAAALMAALSAVSEHGGVVVVAVGNAHLPVLRESLGADAQVISLARIDEGLPDRANAPWKLERFSYLLAHEQVLPLRTASDLEAAPFDYLALAESLGVDMTRAAART